MRRFHPEAIRFMPLKLFPVRFVAASLLFAGHVSAASPVLKKGDAAPEIKVASWAQGEPVKAFEGDKVYIVEFWATWCGPCVASIPHVDALQKKYAAKGLVVIGQNLGEDAPTVSAFVRKMAGKMSYRVTVDDKSGGGRMAKTWLEAAGENGIPCAFIVNKSGRIAYIGHPMEIKDELLEKLLAEPSQKKESDGEEELVPTDSSAKSGELADAVRAAIAAGKWDEAEAALARLQEGLPAASAHVGGLLTVDLMLARKRTSDALGVAGALREDFSKNPAVLAALANHLAPAAGTPEDALALAEKIAGPLVSGEGDAAASATVALARVAFIRGDAAKAVALLEKAPAPVSESLRRDIASALADYRNNRLPKLAR